MRPAIESVPAIVGRQGELGRLRRAVEATATGTPRVLEVVGDPGLGKSFLLAELAGYAGQGGLKVIAARAAESERGVPFAAVAALVEAVAGPAGLSQLAAWGTGSQSRQYHAIQQVRAALGRLAARRPVAVLVDDLHWADAASVELLRQLVARPPGPVLTAVAYRPRQAPECVGALLSVIGLDVRGTRLALEPLAPELVRELVTDPAVPAALLDAVGGNPRYARALGIAGPVARWDGRAVPAEVAAALGVDLLPELAPLDEGHRRVLRAAAILGEPVDPALLTGVLADVEESAEDVPAALDALVRRDLLRRGDTAGLRFRHPFVAAAILTTAPPVWRLAIHRAALARLRRDGAGAAALAPHVAQLARVGQSDAVALLRRAAGQVVAADPALAAGWLAEATRLAGPQAAEDLRVELIIGQARARLSAAEVGTCRALLAGLLDWLPAGHPRWADAAALAGLADRVLGAPDGAAPAVLQGAAAEPGAAEPGAPGATVAVLADHVASGALLRRSGDAVELAARAVQAAVDAEPPVRAAVQATAAMAAACHGPTAAAQEWVAAAREVVDGLRDQELRGTLDPIGQLAWAEAMLEQDSAARRHFGRAIGVADRFGEEYLRTYLLLGRSYVLWRVGDLPGAEQDATRAEEGARRVDAVSLAAASAASRAAVALWHHGPAEALPLARRAVQEVTDPEQDWAAVITRQVLALVSLHGGDPRTARTLLLGACGGPGLPHADLFCRARWLGVLTETELTLGDTAAARLSADAAAKAAEESGLTGQRGHAVLAAARVAADPDAAAEGAAQAAALFAEAGQPLEEAHAWRHAASVARGAGQFDSAEWCLSRVREIAEASRARWLGDVALGHQRGTSGLAGRSYGTAAALLTRREQSIADLLVAGLTNAEIAGRLHLTVKTIESHLTRIYRKLGVRSRTAAAALLAVVHRADQLG